MTFPFEGSTELPRDDYLFDGWDPLAVEPDEFEDADEDD